MLRMRGILKRWCSQSTSGTRQYASATATTKAVRACMRRAKEVRAGLFAAPFGAGVWAIPLGFVRAVDDFERARRAVIGSAFAACIIYTAIGVTIRFGFARLPPPLLALLAGSG